MHLNLKLVAQVDRHYFFVGRDLVMDEIAIPQPQDDPADEASGRSGGESRRAEQPQRRRPRMMSAADCIAVLSQRVGLVTLRVISTAQANTIRGACTAILQHHERQQHGPARTVVNEKDLAGRLRKNPGLAKLLEPLLMDWPTLLRSP
jgi:hypothetical protein